MFEGTRPHPVRAHPNGGDGVQGGGGDSGDSAAQQNTGKLTLTESYGRHIVKNGTVVP